jgi:hypothetical protein
MTDMSMKHWFQPGKRDPNKVQPNGNGGRYNAQPFTGGRVTKEEAEAVAKRRAKRFTRWMKNRANKGHKMPSHMDPSKVTR